MADGRPHSGRRSGAAEPGMGGSRDIYVFALPKEKGIQIVTLNIQRERENDREQQ